MSVLEEAFALDENVCFMALLSLKNMLLVLVMEMSIPQCTGILSVCKNMIFDILDFCCPRQKNPYACCKLIRDST